MAKDSGGGGFLWLIIGLIIGVAGTVAIYLFLNRPAAEAPQVEIVPGVKMETPPLPPEPAAVVPAPVVVPTPKPATPHRTQPDDQIADDAAASGMTASAEPPPVDPNQATN